MDFLNSTRRSPDFFPCAHFFSCPIGLLLEFVKIFSSTCCCSSLSSRLRFSTKVFRLKPPGPLRRELFIKVTIHFYPGFPLSLKIFFGFPSHHFPQFFSSHNSECHSEEVSYLTSFYQILQCTMFFPLPSINAILLLTFSS